MKNFFLVLFATTLISGCMPHNIAHNYKPTPHPELAGTWIGSATGQTHTMLLRADGTGELCWESMGNYKTTPVTLTQDKIITMTDSNLKLNSDGTFSQCAYGICMNFKRTDHVPAACREWLAK